MNSEELKLLVKQGEGLAAEFKEHFTSKIDEDLVAFANTRGGSILLGVDNAGTITGEKLTNDMKARISSIARNCKPAIDVFASQLENAVVIEVPEGAEKPYSCASGYFRRLDGATQKLNHDELRLMFSQNEAVAYEKKASTNATLSALSHKKLARFLKEANIGAGVGKPAALLTSFSMLENSFVNNAGVLFFAKDPRALISQCQSSMIAFKDTEGTLIYDRMDVKDDLLEQFTQAMFFLKKHLNISSTIRGIKRTDEYELPLEALREAVANAIVHRDYSVRGTDLAIRVFPDRVEIANPACIPQGTKPSDLEGVSIRHNEIIADMFYRLDVAERAGTGITKMKRLMKEAKLKAPRINLGLFYRISFLRPGKREGAISEKTREKTVEKTVEKILSSIRQNPKITASELVSITGLTRRGVEWNLKKLKESRIIRRVGPDKGGRWEVKE